VVKRCVISAIILIITLASFVVFRIHHLRGLPDEVLMALAIFPNNSNSPTHYFVIRHDGRFEHSLGVKVHVRGFYPPLYRRRFMSSVDESETIMLEENDMQYIRKLLETINQTPNIFTTEFLYVKWGGHRVALWYGGQIIDVFMWDFPTIEFERLVNEIFRLALLPIHMSRVEPVEPWLH